MQRVLCLAVVVGAALDLENEPPKALGSHSPPLGDIPRVAAGSISQRTFYNDYVLLGRPVVLTSLPSVDSDGDNTDPLLGSHVLERWKDDEYLRTVYGNEQVSVDPVTNENRALVGEDMALKDFLGAYHQKPWYAISEVPKRMAEVVQVPTIIAASPYQRLMQDVVLWFSSKDTNSHLHYDNIQNLMCVISGSKRFIMIDKKHAHHVTIDVPKGDYSAVDTDEVDLQKYPGLRDVPWWQADIDPGSCLYIPVNWFHQVRSSKRTLAINLWWTAFSFSAGELALLSNQKNITNDVDNCNSRAAVDPETSDRRTGGGGGSVATSNRRMMLSEVEFAPTEQLRYQLFRLFDEHGGPLPERVVRDCFLAEDTLEPLLDRKDPDEYTGERGEDAEATDRSNAGNAGGKEGFGLLDSNGNWVLDREEIASAPAAILNKAFPAFEAGALYVKCRSEEGWVKANSGLVSKD